jgi:hypothetical protein
MHDGGGVLCGQDTGYGGSGSYYLVDPESGTSKLLFKKNDFAHLQSASLDPGEITHDGRWLVAWVFGLFGQGYTADNGTFTTPHATVVLDLLDKAKLYYFGPGCTSTTPPSGDWIYHVSRVGSTMPDIFRMKIGDLMTRASYQLELGNADDDWGHEYMPRISSDGGWLIYAASTGCHDWWTCDYEIFVHKLEAGSGSRERLTFNKANDSFPSLYVGQLWSPGSNADAGLPGDRGPVTIDAGTGPGGGGSGCGMVDMPAGSPALRLLLLLLLIVLIRKEYAGRRDKHGPPRTARGREGAPAAGAMAIDQAAPRRAPADGRPRTPFHARCGRRAPGPDPAAADRRSPGPARSCAGPRP